MNYFKAAEEVLKSVPALEEAQENLKKREKRLLGSGTPQDISGVDYSKPFTNSHQVNDTLNELLELAECRNNIEENSKKLKEIYDITDQLSDKFKKLLHKWYFEQHKKETIMEEMNIWSSSTLYDLRNKAIADFALRYYGAAALSSI